MTSHSPWIENLTIYGDNLSSYYLVCALVSFLAMVLTLWYQRRAGKLSGEVSTPSDEVVFPDLKECSSDNIDVSDTGSTTPVKPTKTDKNALLEEVAQTLSDDQLLEEKEMEKQQLENIFELLKQQQDKFQIGTIEELQDQMKLYKS